MAEDKAEIFNPPEVEVTPQDNTIAAGIIEDIKAESINVLPEPNSTEAGQVNNTPETLLTETECTAILHTIYSLIAFSMNSEEPPKDIIELRGKQFFLISQRYNMNVKYLDIAFFGIGIAGDIGIMYKNRKIKEEVKLPPKPNTDEFRLQNLPEPNLNPNRGML